MNPRIVGALAVVGLGPSAGGQSPSFAYSFGVANPQLAPGQSTMVTVLCGFSPGFGGVVTAPGLPGSGVVLGLSTGAFGIAGTGGGWTLGAPPTGSLIAPYNFTGTNQGTAAGTGITGVLWGNGFPPPLGTVSSVNPTPLWHATFTAPGVAGVVTAPVWIPALTLAAMACLAARGASAGRSLNL